MKKLFTTLLMFSVLRAVAQPTQTNVAYGSNVQQKLDYWKAAAASSPIVILVHGGGWYSGSKNEANFQNISQLFKNAGYAAVNIDYRLDTAASYPGYPAQPSDLACAVAWTKQNAASLNGDSSRVVLFGHSAGAHLVSLHGLHQYSNLLNGCGYSAALNVSAVVSVSGVYDFDVMTPARWPNVVKMLGDSAANWVDAQPIEHISSSTNTAFIALTGQLDNFVGTQQALNFRDSMLAHGQCLSFRYLAGYDHFTIINSLTTSSAVYIQTMNFLDSLWQDKICSSTQVEDSPFSYNQIIILPNPFSTQTILQADNAFQGATLTVSNAFGQTVKEIKNIFDQAVVLSRNNLTGGLYFVQLTQDNKVIATKKLVITD